MSIHSTLLQLSGNLLKTMATCTVCFAPIWTTASLDKTQVADKPKRFVSCLVKLPSPCIQFSIAKLLRSSNFQRVEFAVNESALGVLDEEEQVRKEEHVNDFGNDSVSSEYGEKESRHCEVYVCNLPRRYDVAALFEKFKPFGTVISVKVSRNASGESEGCGYVTMESLSSARDAIAALDGSDADGRNMRVTFSAELNYGRSNPEARNSSAQKVFIYEGPYKLYVGNLSRAVRPEFLRNEFSKFGNVASVRIFHENRAGRWHIYGFVSFHLEKERDAALVLNGMMVYGRNLVVKEGNPKR